MAGYIRGITIEFGADTTKLNNALQKTQGTINKTQAELRQINKSLKFNPGNTTLLKQKFELLQQAVKETRSKLEQLQDMQKKMDDAGVEKTSAQYRELQREIIKAKNQVDRAEGELKRFGSVGKQQVKAVGAQFEKVGKQAQQFGKKLTGTMSIASGLMLYYGKTAIDAYVNQEQQELKLEKVLRNKLDLTDQQIQKIKDLTAAQQEQGIIGDEVQMAGAKAIASNLKEADSLEKLIPIMNDAIALKYGYNATEENAAAVGLAFQKALSGNVKGLEKYGIVLTDSEKEIMKNGTETQKIAVLQDAWTRSIKGTNAEMANTDAGKYQQLKNTLGDLQEELGKILLPALADVVRWAQEKLLPVIEKIIGYLQQHPMIAKVALAIMAITAVLGPVIVVIGSLISTIGTLISMASMLAPLFAAVGTAIGGVALPILAIIAAIALLVAAGVALYKNWDKIKQLASTVWNGIKNAITKVVTVISERVKTNFNTLKKAVTTVWNGIKNAIINPIKAAMSTVKAVIDKIKSFFKFKVHLPHIKLPHFKIKPSGWSLGDLLKGSIPSLSIAWYKKGGIFNSPSVIGVGEAGPEAVLPIDKLNVMMASMADSIVNGITTSMALSGAGDGGNITIPIYLYPNGAKMGEETVKMYDKYKRILG